MYNDVFKKRAGTAALGALVALLMCYPEDAMNAVRAACGLWAQSVMPALFPYMVASSLLVSVAGSKALAIPLSFLGGSPAGARLVSLAAPCAKKAQTLAALCTTASPLYILGALSGGPRMLLAHWLGACAAYALIRLIPFSTKAPQATPNPQAPHRPSFAGIARDSTLATLAICGYMALFTVLAALLTRVLPLTQTLKTLLLCLLEMASGCAELLSLGLPAAQTTPLLCAAVSFGGLSIFMQNALFLKPAGVNMGAQLAARLVHAAAAGGLCAASFWVW